MYTGYGSTTLYLLRYRLYIGASILRGAGVFVRFLFPLVGDTVALLGGTVSLFGANCSITTVVRIFGDLVLNRAELCSRMNVQILIARLHVRGQLSSRVSNYLNSRLVHVWCHLTSRPLMTQRDVNS
jgi:hypothetical protein